MRKSSHVAHFLWIWSCPCDIVIIKCASYIKVFRSFFCWTVISYQNVSFLIAQLFHTLNAQMLINVTNFVQNLNGNLPWMTVENTSEVNCLLNLCPKINLYILDLRHVSSEDCVNHLVANYMFNPTALFVIFINSIKEFNLYFLARRYVDKVLLLDKDGQIFSYFPYKYGNVNNPDLAPINIGLCNSTQEINLNSIGQKAKSWENTTINVLFRVTAPYVTGNNDGMEENCIKLFKKYLKVNASIKYLQFGTTTVPYLKQKKELESYRADIFGGHITTISSDVVRFDITPSYFYDSMRFVTPRPLPMSVWKRLYRVVPQRFWMLLLVATIISSTISKLFYQIGLQDKCFALLQILVGAPIRLHTSRVSEKTLFTAWLIYFTIISNLFKNAMLIITATSMDMEPLDTLEDIINSKLPIQSMFDLKPFMDPSSELGNVHKCFNNHMTCFNKTAFQQNAITVGGHGILSFYTIPKYYMRDGKILVHLSEAAVYYFYVQLLFTKGHPLFPQSSQIILRSLSNGWFPNEFAKIKYRGFVGLCFNFKIDNIKDEPLTHVNNAQIV
ncbi:hypothetical protein HUJ05_008021 [Dendroctonus ponderosae]|nr:hypothetical protein HUJ05_008021 [Dendroctonus ponderosae]